MSRATTLFFQWSLFSELFFMAFSSLIFRHMQDSKLIPCLELHSLSTTFLISFPAFFSQQAKETAVVRRAKYEYYLGNNCE